MGNSLALLHYTIGTNVHIVIYTAYTMFQQQLIHNNLRVKACMEHGIDVSKEDSDEDSDPYAEEFQQHLQLSTGWQDIEQGTIPPISLWNIHKYFVQ